MNRTPLRLLLLAAALAAPLAGLAEEPQPPPEERLDREHLRRELEAARAEMAQAARRVAELSRELAGEARTQAEGHRITLHELRMTRPIVGIVMAEGENGEVVLAGVTPEGPAARAGLQAGDVLERINGHAIEGASPRKRLAHARELIGGLEEGEEVRLDYRREGKRAQVTLKAEKLDRLMVWAPGAGALEPFREIRERFNLDALDLPEGEWPAIEIERLVLGGPDCENGAECRDRRLFRALRWGGLNLAGVDAELGRYFGVDRGALVLSPGRTFEGLRAGDVILAVDGTEVDGPRALMRALREKPAGSRVELDIQRDRSRQTLAVTVPEATALPFIAPPKPPEPPKPPAPPAPDDAI